MVRSDQASNAEGAAIAEKEGMFSLAWAPGAGVRFTVVGTVVNVNAQVRRRAPPSRVCKTTFSPLACADRLFLSFSYTNRSLGATSADRNEPRGTPVTCISQLTESWQARTLRTERATRRDAKRSLPDKRRSQLAIPNILFSSLRAPSCGWRAPSRSATSSRAGSTTATGTTWRACGTARRSPRTSSSTASRWGAPNPPTASPSAPWAARTTRSCSRAATPGSSTRCVQRTDPNGTTQLLEYSMDRDQRRNPYF
eukprot:3894899-Pyramimonas_sp.AAC.1